LQRLLEIETYRMAALLSLPLARELLPQVEDLEARHVALVERISAMDGGDGRDLLGELTKLSLATERYQAGCRSRFSLTGSYANVLSARVRELREEQVPGYQTISEFFDRSLSPAWYTCEIAEAALNVLSARLDSTANLLRIRLDVDLPRRNPSLLATDERRTTAQLRLLKTGHALLVVMLTYYLAKLLKLALPGSKAVAAHFNVYLIVFLLITLLAGGVWWMRTRAKDRSH
jgi:uncharacterized membrane-anchored protein